MSHSKEKLVGDGYVVGGDIGEDFWVATIMGPSLSHQERLEIAAHIRACWNACPFEDPVKMVNDIKKLLEKMLYEDVMSLGSEGDKDKRHRIILFDDELKAARALLSHIKKGE